MPQVRRRTQRPRPPHRRNDCEGTAVVCSSHVANKRTYMQPGLVYHQRCCLLHSVAGGQTRWRDICVHKNGRVERNSHTRQTSFLTSRTPPPPAHTQHTHVPKNTPIHQPSQTHVYAILLKRFIRMAIPSGRMQPPHAHTTASEVAGVASEVCFAKKRGCLGSRAVAWC